MRVFIVIPVVLVILLVVFIHRPRTLVVWGSFFAHKQTPNPGGSCVSMPGYPN
jgi:hypothetical protein